MQLIRRIDEYLDACPRAVSEVETVGPFTLFFNRDAAHSHLSYARPAGPQVTLPGEPLLASIAAVRERFRRRGRRPRWEFIAELAPGLPGALRAAGFTEQQNYPLMVVTRGSFRPMSVEGAAVRRVGSGPELPGVTKMLMRAFDQDPDPGMGAALERYLAGGLRLFTLFVDGEEGPQPVAAGAHTPLNGATELGGVCTLPEYRRRGFAGAVSSAAIQDAFDWGCDCVFLTAGDEPARLLYERLGFRSIATGMGVTEPE